MAARSQARGRIRGGAGPAPAEGGGLADVAAADQDFEIGAVGDKMGEPAAENAVAAEDQDFHGRKAAVPPGKGQCGRVASRKKPRWAVMSSRAMKARGSKPVAA